MTNRPNSFSPYSGRTLVCYVLGWPSLFILVTSLRAQPVMAPALQNLSALAAASGLQSPNQLSMPSASSSVLAPTKTSTNPAPINVGPIEIRPLFSYQLTYGSGLQFRPGSQANSTIQQISAGLSAKIAQGLTVDYAAIQSVYSDQQFSDALNHSFQINGGKEKSFSLGGWAMGFSQGYSSSFAPQIETARQTKQQSVTTGLTAAYPFNQVLSLALGVNQNLRFSSDVGDAYEWTTMNWLNAQATAKVNAGIGVGLGIANLANQPNNSYQRFLARAGWKISKKVGLDFDAGLESRDSGGPAGAATTPIFNVSLGYKPFNYTSMRLSTSRSSEVSLFQNQTSNRKTWNLGLSQRLLGKLSFNASVGEQRSSFSSSSVTVAPGRNDVTQNFGLGLGVAFRQRGTIAASYARTKNETNFAGFGLNSNQYGLTIGFRY